MHSMSKDKLFKLIKRQLALAQVEAHVRQQLMRRLNTLQKATQGRIGIEDLNNINARELNRLIRDIDALAKTAYQDMATQAQEYAGDLAHNETEFIYREFGNAWGAPKKPPSIVTPLVLGATIGEWLGKQGRDYAHNVTMAVRNKDSITHLFHRFGNGLKAFTTTLTSATVNQRRVQIADKSSHILGYQHNSVLDSRVSDICLVRHLKRWDKDKQPIGHDLDYREPPLHPHCRSFITFIFDFYDDSKINGITVDDWLDSMSEAEQNEVLGVGKADMYRRGDITLRDLLDQSGRPKPLYRFASEKINTVASTHFQRSYEFLEWEITKYSDLSTLELRKQLGVGIKWEVATLNTKTRRLFGAKTNRVWLSDDTLIKQIRHRQGQPIGLDSYRLVDDVLNNADEYAIESANNIVFFRKNEVWYKVAVKATQDKEELYVLSFSRSNLKEVERKTGTKKATR